MRSGFWTVIGVVLTVAMIVLSAFINYSFGYSLGTTETNARIFGGVSVVAVGVMAVLPLRISAHWSARRKGRALLGATVFLILVAYAIAGSVGFGIVNRSQLAGSGENLIAQLIDQVADRDRALSQLKGLGGAQTAAAVSAKIDAAKKNRLWDQSQGCRNATAMPSRDFCQGVDFLRESLRTRRPRRCWARRSRS
jgi:ABC-type transport system involved in multi-copper enzyme maturation permease subunit